VDFIPACDVELKRQARRGFEGPRRRGGLRVHQRQRPAARITAAMQSGAGPDIIQMLHNWPHLYANGLVDVSDLVEWQVKEQGRSTPVRGQRKVGGKFLALPHGIVPGLIAYRKSWFDEIGATTFPKTYEELRQVSPKLKKKGKPTARPSAIPSATPRLGVPADVELRRDGGRQERQDRDRQQGFGGGGQVHDRVLEGQLRRGRPGLGRHQQQPGLPGGEICAR
jgi:hypothetical protein